MYGIFHWHLACGYHSKALFTKSGIAVKMQVLTYILRWVVCLGCGSADCGGFWKKGPETGPDIRDQPTAEKVKGVSPYSKT